MLAVIPARLGSTRFPEKVIAPILGKPMIQWVYERTLEASSIDDVIIATDAQEVMDVVASFGGKSVMTSVDHKTGTDRIAEAIEGMEADLIINVQGDEPLIPGEVLDRLVAKMQANPDVEMGTVAVPFAEDDEKFSDPNCVKCVASSSGFALYFSRAAIPYARNERGSTLPLHHWGIYAYRRDFLERFVKFEQSPLELCESLEQLRALENGARILLIQAEESTIGVDVPGDIEKVEALLK